jgi:hypothetical protein
MARRNIAHASIQMRFSRRAFALWRLHVGGARAHQVRNEPVVLHGACACQICHLAQQVRLLARHPRVVGDQRLRKLAAADLSPRRQHSVKIHAF